MLGSLWFNSFSSAAPAGEPAYELISTTILGSSAASVTFSGLGTSAAAYKHLQIRYTARQSGSGGSLRLQFNGDTGTNYAYHQLYGFGSGAPGSNGNTSQTVLQIGGTSNNTYGANVFAGGVIDLLDFSSVSKNKTARGLSGTPDPATYFIYLRSGVWMSTAAMTSITIFGDSSNLDTNSRFSLYGLR